MQIFQARPSRGVVANALTWLHQGNRSVFSYATEFWMLAADRGWNQWVLVDACVLEGALSSHRGVTHWMVLSISKKRISRSDYGEGFSSSAPTEDEGTKEPMLMGHISLPKRHRGNTQGWRIHCAQHAVVGQMPSLAVTEVSFSCLGAYVHITQPSFETFLRGRSVPSVTQVQRDAGFQIRTFSSLSSRCTAGRTRSSASPFFCYCRSCAPSPINPLPWL